jgi:hypothetical protein
MPRIAVLIGAVVIDDRTKRLADGRVKKKDWNWCPMGPMNRPTTRSKLISETSTKSRSGRGTERRSTACSMAATASAGLDQYSSAPSSTGRGSD